MADSQIQLPYTATTSGDTLDATLIGAVKRERMVLGNDATSAVAVVTSSGDLKVALTSGIISLSSAIAISSGLITFSSAPTVNVSSGLITLTGLNTVTLSSNPVASQIISLSSGTVTLSSAIGISSGSINTLTSGTYLVNATSTSGLLSDITRGVSLAFFNFTATSSGLKSLVAASGSNKVKLVSYVLVCNSTQELAFYSSNTALGGSSSAPMVLSSYSGISAVGDRTSWVLETSAAGSLQIYLGNGGIVAGHGSYIYEV